MLALQQERQEKKEKKKKQTPTHFILLIHIIQSTYHTVARRVASQRNTGPGRKSTRAPPPQARRLGYIRRWQARIMRKHRFSIDSGRWSGSRNIFAPPACVCAVWKRFQVRFHIDTQDYSSIIDRCVSNDKKIPSPNLDAPGKARAPSSPNQSSAMYVYCGLLCSTGEEGGGGGLYDKSTRVFRHRLHCLPPLCTTKNASRCWSRKEPKSRKIRTRHNNTVF